MTNLTLDSATQLYQWEIPGAAVDDGSEDGCYLRELEALDIAWQGNPERPGNFDVQVIGWYRDCLRQIGVEMPEGKPAAEYLEAMNANGLDPKACIDAHHQQ